MSINNRHLIIGVTFLFCISFLVGYSIGYANYLGKYSTKKVNMKLKYSFLDIAINNLKVIIIIIIGAILFGVPTIVAIVNNSMSLGILIGEYSLIYDPLKISILILPHGIFEIPAIIIAGAAGFKIPYEIVRYLAGKKEQILTKEDIKEYLTMALISIILIVIAAWIEANVTLKIAKAMLNSTKGV